MELKASISYNMILANCVKNFLRNPFNGIESYPNPLWDEPSPLRIHSMELKASKARALK